MRSHLIQTVSFAIAGLWLLTSGTRLTSAQVISVSELVQQKTQWKTFAEDGRKLQFEGRFEGRTAEAFQLHKFDVTCRLPSNIKLPDRMRAGQRLDVTGKFVSTDGKLSFLISRLVVRDTDIENITNLAAAIPENDSDKLMALADEFLPTAEFYSDKALQQEIVALQTRAVTLKRKLASGDLQQLRIVLALIQSLNLNQQLRDSLQFETLITEWQQAGVDLAALLKEVQKLDG